MAKMDMDRAQAVIDFIETLLLPDGTGAGQPFLLRDWQKDIIRQVYAPTTPAGNRQVREALLSIPRKNGKTAIVAGLCLAHLCGPEAIRNGQLYSLSVDREQASILFNYAASMVYMDDELSERLNIVESRKEIIDPYLEDKDGRVIGSGSRYKVLSGEKKGKMGKSSSCIFFDELAEFGADRALYDALMTSRGAHAEPLVWVFSTQSPDDTAVLSELIDYGQKVKDGEIEDETFRSFVYAASEDADPWDEATWFECNPALDDFCSLEVMRNTAQKAQRMPSAEAAFRNLHLNQRIDSAAHFITPSMWKACGGTPDLDVFQHAEIFAGLDLSKKNDLTALVLVAVDEEGIFHARPFFWTPGDTITERGERDRVPYALWRDQGYLEAKPGRTIDYGWVAEKIGELHGEHPISSLFFDRWRIDDLFRELDKAGVDTAVAHWKTDEETGARTLIYPDTPSDNTLVLVPYGQGYKDMNPAVEAVEDIITEERLRHGMHPVLQWCASNTRIQSDPAGSRKFDKVKSTGRIDGMVALAMALYGRSIEVTDDGGMILLGHLDLEAMLA